jgi:hypothetical protein
MIIPYSPVFSEKWIRQSGQSNRSLWSGHVKRKASIILLQQCFFIIQRIVVSDCWGFSMEIYDFRANLSKLSFRKEHTMKGNVMPRNYNRSGRIDPQIPPDFEW